MLGEHKVAIEFLYVLTKEFLHTLCNVSTHDCTVLLVACACAYQGLWVCVCVLVDA